MRLGLANTAAFGNGSNSDLPGVKPVANLASAVVFIAAFIQLTPVVPAGVDAGAG